MGPFFLDLSYPFLVHVRVCASYVVLPSFPWRASSSVHDEHRPLFSRVLVPPVVGPCTRTWLLCCFAQFCMARVRFSPRRVTATFFPDSPYRMFKGPCRHMCTCVCLVRGFAQFCMARVQLRARWASATFFPVSPYRPLWVRVRVGDMYVVLPSFPWRASGSVHGGRRPLFPRVPVQAIHGAVYESVYVCLPHTWLCPILHGARPVPSTPVSCPFLPGRMLLRFLPVSPFT